MKFIITLIGVAESVRIKIYIASRYETEQLRGGNVAREAPHILDNLYRDVIVERKE